MKDVVMAPRTEFLASMEKELHDLCQPLTTLQCRLELAVMCADEASLMEAVKGGMQETERLFAGIGQMRKRLQRELSGLQDGEEVEG